MTGRPAIVDTNVVVAGLLTRDTASPVARVLDGMIAGVFPFVVSTALLAEYRAVLVRPRIRERHGLGPNAIDEILTAIAANAIVREPAATEIAAPDPGDQHLWALLHAVPQAILLTGDAALLDQAPPGASVMTPRAWVDVLG